MDITTRTLLAAVAAPLAKALVAESWTAVPLPAGTDGAGGRFPVGGGGHGPRLQTVLLTEGPSGGCRAAGGAHASWVRRISRVSG